MACPSWTGFSLSDIRDRPKEQDPSTWMAPGPGKQELRVSSQGSWEAKALPMGPWTTSDSVRYTSLL
jgi:hypothetical protein